MSDIVKFSTVEQCIITVGDQQVILDSDVATLYGVETKRINEAVKNNPDKFPQGYIIQLSDLQWKAMKSKISTSLGPGGKVKLPTAFTEKGLYMCSPRYSRARRLRQPQLPLLKLSPRSESYFARQ